MVLLEELEPNGLFRALRSLTIERKGRCKGGSETRNAIRVGDRGTDEKTGGGYGGVRV